MAMMVPRKRIGGGFWIPNLPRCDYAAFKQLRQMAGCASDWETVCLLIRLACDLVNGGRLDTLEAALALLRSQAPSETPPLIRRAGEAPETPAST